MRRVRHTAIRGRLCCRGNPSAAEGRGGGPSRIRRGIWEVQILDEQEIRRLSGQLFFYTDEPAEKAEEEWEPVPQAQQQEPPKEKEAPTRPATPYGLNDEQWEAAAADDPAVAVIAGPGTGKTKTLVSRIAYLIEKKKVVPASINRRDLYPQSGAEMRQRLQRQFKRKRAADAIHHWDLPFPLHADAEGPAAGSDPAG